MPLDNEITHVCIRNYTEKSITLNIKLTFLKHRLYYHIPGQDSFNASQCQQNMLKLSKKCMFKSRDGLKSWPHTCMILDKLLSLHLLYNCEGFSTYLRMRINR